MSRLAPLLITFLVLAAVFGVLEGLFPAVRGQRRWRRGIKTDLAYFFGSPFVNQGAGYVAAAAVLVALAFVAGVPMDRESVREFAHRRTALSSQPLWLQGAQVLVLSDVAGYWSHRLFHSIRLLWPIHAIHHSPTELDWLSAARMHPLNEAGARAFSVAPFLLLGYSPGPLVALPPLITFYCIYSHANVPWSYGPLRYLLVSPVYHRWHHTSEQEGMDKNFASLFPWVDALFGTFYLPRGRQPVVFGVANETVPENLVGQMLYPFRWRRQPAPTGATA